MHERLVASNPSPRVDEQPRARRVLLAEDDTRMRQLLAATLRRDGFSVVEAVNGADLLDAVGEVLADEHAAPLDLIITDIRMPTLSGLDVLSELRWVGARVPVILITAFGDEATHALADRLGAAAIFDKPFDLDALRAAARLWTTPAEP